MRLSDALMEIIAYASFVARKGQMTALPYEQVRTNMQRLISQSETYIDKGGFAREDFDLARFAVFAWVDEAILSSEWEGRRQWQREQLQRTYFQTADAGELFFERLNTIGPHQRDVREVYYLCLALGFSGQYCNEGDDVLLEQLRTSNLKLLTGSSMGLPSLDKEELFPEAYPKGEMVGEAAHSASRGRWSPFTLACAVAPVVLFGLLYIIYTFILGNIGGNLIGTVQ
ncbi:MAG: DotU family type IV/VI secretion system protein [Desulfatitalea sp.]|nr:DotU family type IV/VI secretion system protein [Desulfatitalea sp.]NNK00410.1 DotU family type IV/VI secretion system protein [Desulfatitalea sp.]